MKLAKSLLTLSVLAMASSAVMACEKANVEAYAHPTMFNSSAVETQATRGVYLVGDKMLAAANEAIQGKENVLIDAEANALADDLAAIYGKAFNFKAPALRSEMAHALSQALGLKTPAKNKYTYKDVAGHKLQSHIYKALAANVMIGYPDKKFRPDQKITKAEVFATLAQLLTNEPKNTVVGKLANKYEMKEIPAWATAPTVKVMEAGILDNLPDLQSVANNKYLTTEQLQKLVVTLSHSQYYNKEFLANCANTSTVRVKIKERVDARHINIGETVYAETVEAATVNGTEFAAGSKVIGEVVEVARPGIKNPGYVKVKFNTIKNGKVSANFPTVSRAAVKEAKTTNFVARILATPVSAIGRVGGTAARTISTEAMNISNDGERYADNWSNAIANTFSLQPMAGLRNVGKSFVTLGYFVADTAKLAVSGTFGVLYELGDEVRYVILPSSINDSALNPGDELSIIYKK